MPNMSATTKSAISAVSRGVNIAALYPKHARVPLELAADHAKVDLRDKVAIDPRYLRPAEVSELRGDASKARERLGWKPTLSFVELVHMMVDHDLELAARERRDG